MTKPGIDIGDQRRDYEAELLSRADLAEDPIALFARWYETAQSTEEIVDPNAMTLATVSTAGQPSVRTVLLKFFDAEGFVFYTNYGSRKAAEIEVNPRVALHFLWNELDRQVQIRGVAEKVGHAESMRYFLSRPRESQIAAWVSHQSTALSARSLLESKFAEMKRKFAEGEVPVPTFWGGYRVRHEAVEFWQGRPHRLHDRFLYERDGDGWSVRRLAP